MSEWAGGGWVGWWEGGGGGGGGARTKSVGDSPVNQKGEEGKSGFGGKNGFYERETSQRRGK